jgi:hypothetical protein
MHGMVNITRNLKRYDIELRRRPIVSTANYDFRPVQLKRSLQRHPARVASAGGHERRFKRKSRTSALPPIPDIIAASHRLASYQSDRRRGMAHRREHRQVAGAARGSPQLARRNEVCGGTLTMSAPRRLVLQLRRYRCNVATAASGPLATGYIPTADRRFRGTAEVRSLCQRLAATPLRPEAAVG